MRQIQSVRIAVWPVQIEEENDGHRAGLYGWQVDCARLVYHLEQSAVTSNRQNANKSVLRA